MTYEELIAEINAKITTNGAGEITGAILNDVLKDIVATLKDNADTVHVFISGNNNNATFMWPFEDTAVNDLSIEGYNANGFSAASKYPLNGMRIVNGSGRYATFNNGSWVGNLTSLIKGEWYYITYSAVSDNTNCSIYIRPNN